MCGKVLYILPVATLALSAFATAGPSRSTANPEGEVSTLTLNGQAKAQESATAALQSADSTLQSIKASADYCETATVPPCFPGGEHAMWSFVGRNVRYPAAALGRGVQGRLLVQFLVEKDGSVSNIRVEGWTDCKDKNDATRLRGVMVTAYSQDSLAGIPEEEVAYQAGVDSIKAEAVRVVKAMPKWTPGYMDKAKTRPCITPMALPMTFRLN